MKKIVHKISLLILLLLSQAAIADLPKAPEFRLPTENGEILLANFQGKLVYVDFWASWCRPCKNSFPWMIEMKKKYKHLPFEVIAINLDKDRNLANQFIASQAINFPVAFDPQAKVAKQYGVEGMPSSYLVDPQGRLRIRYTGFWNKSKNEKEQTINRLLQSLNKNQVNSHTNKF